MVGGYIEKLLYVDLSSGEVKVKPLPLKVVRKFLGGKGLAVKILYDEIKPGTEPLGPNNVIAFTTGPLTGVPISGGVKVNVAAKSPLTGTWNDSSSSGFWGPQLKLAGYDAAIIKGKSRKPVYISIIDGKVEIRSAEHLWGMNTLETDKNIKKELGDKHVSIATIGSAGEKLVRYANVSLDVWRHAGRGGTGAVMGSKNLKAIVVRGKGRVPIEQPGNLKPLAKELTEIVRKQINRWGMKHNIPKEGTNEFLDVEIETGVTPAKNFKTVPLIRMQEELRKYTIANKSCPGCAQTCWVIRAVSEGSYAGVKGVGPEYESVACLGPICGIVNIPAILKCNLQCNLYGLDTISTGVSIAFAMECYENGILTKDDVNGLDLHFGNDKAMIRMVEMIGKREGFGSTLGEGVMRASEKVGRASERFAIHTKGLEYPGYQPKNLPAMALAFATADRGACHLRAWVSEEVQSRTLKMGETEKEELKKRARLVAATQNNSAWLNNIGMCTHVSSFFGYPLLPQILKAVTGWDFDELQLNSIGERTYNMTRLFNIREGFTRKDDNLPWRFTHEPLLDGPNKGAYIKPDALEIMLDEYYSVRGWDVKKGIPKKDTLNRLQIII